MVHCHRKRSNKSTLVTNFNVAKINVESDLFLVRLDGLQHLDIYKHTLHEAQDQN